MKLKNHLKSILKKKQKTNKEIAEKMEVKPSAVSYWANNKTDILQAHHKKLSKVLDTTEEKLFFAEDTEGQKYKLMKIKE